MWLAVALLVLLSGCVAAGPVAPAYYGGYDYAAPYAYAAPPPVYYGGPPLGLNFGFVGGTHFHHRPVAANHARHRVVPHRHVDDRGHHRDIH
jgi:hypothetical protein